MTGPRCKLRLTTHINIFSHISTIPPSANFQVCLPVKPNPEKNYPTAFLSPKLLTHLMHRLRYQGQEVPECIRVLQVRLRVPLLGMDEVWELEGVADEEDWSVVPNQVIDALQHQEKNSRCSPPKRNVTMLQSLFKYNCTKMYLWQPKRWWCTTFCTVSFPFREKACLGLFTGLSLKGATIGIDNCSSLSRAFGNKNSNRIQP
jgi:hypothetical protein